MSAHNILRAAFSCAVALLLSATAHAQLFRAYLASSGSDANPCTLPAPCRLLPAALAAVAAGGEIWMLDSANYNTGPVSITKSVTILAIPGALGSVVAMSGDAIDIATGGVNVALRNLVIAPVPGGGGVNGIAMSAGSSLIVDQCVIANLPGEGIAVTTPAKVLVADTIIRDNSGDGLFLQSGVKGIVTRATISNNVATGIYVLSTTALTTTTVDIADSTVDGNSFGIYGKSTDGTAIVRMSVHGSRIVRNVNDGATVESAGAAASLTASNNIVSDNSTGIRAFDGSARVWASGNTVSGNGLGLHNDGGLFESAGNNALRNNGTNFMGTISPVATL
jgi:hypothetical protein